MTDVISSAKKLASFLWKGSPIPAPLTQQAVSQKGGHRNTDASVGVRIPFLK